MTSFKPFLVNVLTIAIVTASTHVFFYNFHLTIHGNLLSIRAIVVLCWHSVTIIIAYIVYTCTSHAIIPFWVHAIQMKRHEEKNGEQSINSTD